MRVIARRSRRVASRLRRDARSSLKVAHRGEELAILSRLSREPIADLADVRERVGDVARGRRLRERHRDGVRRAVVGRGARDGRRGCGVVRVCVVRGVSTPRDDRRRDATKRRDAR